MNSQVTNDPPERNAIPPEKQHSLRDEQGEGAQRGKAHPQPIERDVAERGIPPDRDPDDPASP